MLGTHPRLVLLQLHCIRCAPGEHLPGCVLEKSPGPAVVLHMDIRVEMEVESIVVAVHCRLFF